MMYVQNTTVEYGFHFFGGGGFASAVIFQKKKTICT